MTFQSAVDDAQHPLAQVGRGHDPTTVAHPADARPQVRHAGQRQFGDLAPDIEIDDNALVALAVGADQVAVGGAEEEIVDRRTDHDPAAGEQALFRRQAFLHPGLVVVHEAPVIGPASGSVATSQISGTSLRARTKLLRSGA